MRNLAEKFNCQNRQSLFGWNCRQRHSANSPLSTVSHTFPPGIGTGTQSSAPSIPDQAPTKIPRPFVLISATSRIGVPSFGASIIGSHLESVIGLVLSAVLFAAAFLFLTYYPHGWPLPLAQRMSGNPDLDRLSRQIDKDVCAGSLTRTIAFCRNSVTGNGRTQIECSHLNSLGDGDKTFVVVCETWA